MPGCCAGPGITLLACGRPAEAAAALHTALRVRPSGILEVYGQLAAALLATVRGDFEAGRAAIGRCRRAAPEPLPFARWYCAAAAELELWAGDPDRAFAAAAEGLAAVDRTDYRRHAGTLGWLALRAAADRADLARARHDAAAEDQARADADQLRRTWSNPPWLTAEPANRARALRALLDAEQSRVVGHPTRSCGPWPPVAPVPATGRTRPPTRPGGRPKPCSPSTRPARPRPGCLRTGHAIARGAGAVPLQREIETLARYARLDLQPSPPSESSPPVPAALQALTRREREILDQLAAGLTNRQIAERLYISPRTAAVHVSSVLHKLGVPDRVQAAHLARKLHGQ